MLIPPELEQELIQFAFIIDNNKKISEVYLSKGMATILEPYSKRVQEGNLGITDTDEHGKPIYRYAYTPLNNELYCIETNEDYYEPCSYFESNFEDPCSYFDSELHFRTSGLNRYGASPIIMHIKKLLQDFRYSILDTNDPDITDLLGNFDFFRGLLHKRHMEFTSDPFQSGCHGQTIERTARLFVAGKQELWKGDKSSLAFNNYDSQEQDTKDNRIIYSRLYTCEAGYNILTFLVLLEDRIMRLNYSSKDLLDFDFSPHYIPDTETYLFANNLNLEEFNLPATPEGFLLLKMMEI